MHELRRMQQLRTASEWWNSVTCHTHNKEPACAPALNSQQVHWYPQDYAVDGDYVCNLFDSSKIAAFFLNPISHEPGYRLHVIHCLPSIQVLDRKGKTRRSEGHVYLTAKPQVCHTSSQNTTSVWLVFCYLLCCQRWSQRRGGGPSRCTARSAIVSSSLWPSADGQHGPQAEIMFVLILAKSPVITQWKDVFAVN